MRKVTIRPLLTSPYLRRGLGYQGTERRNFLGSHKIAVSSLVIKLQVKSAELVEMVSYLLHRLQYGYVDNEAPYPPIILFWKKIQLKVPQNWGATAFLGSADL